VAAASAAPIFNISVGDGVLDLFRPTRAAPEVPAPQILAGLSNVNKMLLNPTRDIGADMPIAEFCNSFGLQHTYSRNSWKMLMTSHVIFASSHLIISLKWDSNLEKRRLYRMLLSAGLFSVSCNFLLHSYGH
jgi:hypothetical protein